MCIRSRVHVCVSILPSLLCLCCSEQPKSTYTDHLKTYCLLSPQWHIKSIQTDVYDIHKLISTHSSCLILACTIRLDEKRLQVFSQMFCEVLRSLMENQKLLHLLFSSDQRSAERRTIWRKISLRTSLHVATAITKFTPHSMKIPPPLSSGGTASAGYRLLGFNRYRVWNSAQRGQFLQHDIRENPLNTESPLDVAWQTR